MAWVILSEVPHQPGEEEEEGEKDFQDWYRTGGILEELQSESLH